MFDGQHFKLLPLDNHLAELCFDTIASKVNVIDTTSFAELEEIAELLAKTPPRGLLISSAKTHFCLGADIQQFPALFDRGEAEQRQWLAQAHRSFNALENLPLPIVAAVNGMALGGGAELALLADFRVVGTSSKMGFPEVTLGINPCFGGMARFTHFAGVRTALDWMLNGEFHAADRLFAEDVADALCSDDSLRETALGWLQEAARGELDFRAQREKKHRLIPITAMADEDLDALAQALRKNLAEPSVAQLQLLANLPAMCRQPLTEALQIEADGFVALAKTPQAAQTIQTFLDQQAAKQKTPHSKSATSP